MKKALLVGINYPGTPSQLNGCVNDVMAMSELLSNKFDFKSKNKRMLIDHAATTSNILDRLEWLVKDSKSGDVLYFHYSGHGSQFIDRDYDSDYEPDGKDEIICPIDLDWRRKIITDDMLRRIFNKVPEGVNLTVVLDCCHSGSGIDVGDNASHYHSPRSKNSSEFYNTPNTNRLMEAPADIMNRSIGMDIPVKLRGVNINNTGVLISGCKSNQTSADAWIHNKYMGAATYYLIDAINNGYNTYETVIGHMSYSLKRHGYSQSPQLNGSTNYTTHTFLEPFDINVKEETVNIENTLELKMHEDSLVKLTGFVASNATKIENVITAINALNDNINAVVKTVDDIKDKSVSKSKSTTVKKSKSKPKAKKI